MSNVFEFLIRQYILVTSSGNTVTTDVKKSTECSRAPIVVPASPPVQKLLTSLAHPIKVPPSPDVSQKKLAVRDTHLGMTSGLGFFVSNFRFYDA